VWLHTHYGILLRNVNWRQHGGLHALLRCKVENIQLRDLVFWQIATFERNIILGAFAATIYFRHVCPSVCPHGTARLPVDCLSRMFKFH
jgi:hypothetical protein